MPHLHRILIHEFVIANHAPKNKFFQFVENRPAYYNYNYCQSTGNLCMKSRIYLNTYLPGEFHKYSVVQSTMREDKKYDKYSGR